MKIGVLGTGMVGRAIASRLVALGHEVKMGSRTPDNENAAEWVAANGARASQGTFADAAAFGELVFNCTSGDASLVVLRAAGAENLTGKALVDVANTLDFSQGRPPSLLVTTKVAVIGGTDNRRTADCATGWPFPAGNEPAIEIGHLLAEALVETANR